jgi:catechol 2,3-dioxygenase-like lactoylglutathione lyase family enzyme
MQTLGLRHVALQVPDAQRSKEFYVRVLRMQVEWEPDPENVYLTSDGHDNLALHASPDAQVGPQRLDHLGFAVPTAQDVTHWFEHVTAQGAQILKPVKHHRDGATSFYFADPDGTVIQIIHHLPIANRLK